MDDNPDATRMLAILMCDMGFDVRTAGTGTVGMEVARSFLPDYVLLDIVLPDVDGCELARALKGLPGMDAARIVAITAYDDDRAKIRAAEAGCDGYYLKPLSTTVLERLLNVDGDAPSSDRPTRLRAAFTREGQPQFLDDEERAEVTVIVRELGIDHPVRRAFEAGVDTRRLARIADPPLRERLHGASTEAIRRFAARGTPK